ncbi:ATP-binding protein [Streptomyces sp. enrichment culture]|uniref:ATP-binding protein n=1 Tax=Streptomyces sp. enrichment culture TaxID=1795815 RepID=UPI003F55878F
MNDRADGVRVLPGTGEHGRSALLLTDGSGPVSRLADQVEAVQLGLGERLLGRARGVLEERRARCRELLQLAGQLTDALADALRIAEFRGERLGGAHSIPTDGVSSALLAYGLLTLPGMDLASARAARHYVRHTCRSWGLPAGVADDLVAITGELVANALEHTDSPAVAVACVLTADTVTVGVTDDGGGGGEPVISAPSGASEPESESGRGLLITDALATRWGTERAGGGLTVWAEVPVRPR